MFDARKYSKRSILRTFVNKAIQQFQIHLTSAMVEDGTGIVSLTLARNIGVMLRW